MRAINLVLLLAIAGVARPAAAWVCSRALNTDRAEVGPSLSWFKRDLTFAVHADGTDDIAGLDEHTILEQSFQVWVGITGCEIGAPSTDVTFTREPDLVNRDLIGFDFLTPNTNENLMLFRDQGWPHSSRVIALTTTTYSAQTGEIFDADIEFNSMEFEFADLPACCPDCNGTAQDDPDSECRFTDLGNTAVHEIGHVLGLGHPDAWSDIDPDCATGATMCSTAELGDTDKRELSCDDRNGIVFKYPSGQPNQYCRQPECSEAEEACGTCEPVVCEGWAACGFCAPPTPLTNAVRVTAVGFSTGNGDGCQAVAGNALALGLVLLALRRRRCLQSPDRGIRESRR